MSERAAARPEHRALRDELVGLGLRDPRLLHERCARGDLAVERLGGGALPVVLVLMPPPERPNEAYFLCFVPSAGEVVNGRYHPAEPSTCYRVFGLERSVLPDGGLIGFVVEWTARRRRNYDAPADGSPQAFWRAICEVLAGTRIPLHSTTTEPNVPFVLVDELERATWLACVGRPFTRGWPPLEYVRTVSSWNEALEMLATSPRMQVPSGYLQDARTRLGESTYAARMQAIAPISQRILGRKVPPPFGPTEASQVFAQLVQLDLLALLFGAEGDLPPLGVADALLFFYTEGRMPCGWADDGAAWIY